MMAKQKKIDRDQSSHYSFLIIEFLFVPYVPKIFSVETNDFSMTRNFRNISVEFPQ
jgi:hypothetical protein